MGWYRRLIYDVFGRYNRKICPVEFLFSRSNPTRSRISQPILRNSVVQNVVKNNQKKSPNFFAKRFYKADRNKVNHLKPKEFGRWYENPRNLIRLGFLGCGASSVYYWNLETVPYTKKTHFVLVPNSLERKIGELCLELFKITLKGKILASHHPQSIMVEKIGQDIIGALLKGLKRKKKDDERTTSAHLEEFNWEFIVLDDAEVNARCIPGEKIVVTTGLLNLFKTDAEIAIVIGHEFFMSDRFKKMSDLFFRLPLARRNEMEADYIGLLVSASAGYDPWTAPKVYVKFENGSASGSDDYYFTHPHGKKRAELLSQPKVMEEALSMYREALKEKDSDKEGERAYLNFSDRLIGSFLNF